MFDFRGHEPITLAKTDSYSAAIVIDGRRFGCRTGLVFGRPRRFIEPPAEWLERVKPIETAPKKAKGNGRAKSDRYSTAGG
jgi:hypothetical protein